MINDKILEFVLLCVYGLLKVLGSYVTVIISLIATMTPEASGQAVTALEFNLYNRNLHGTRFRNPGCGNI
ncbi:MAG: hypothetical protein K9J12_17245 [Melioribacteraceae bacterium]|nr:hypothetical protein [Melioribacteraceae bacterium]MCF8264671.1 hypothetical protein [Melioribacteraceae bacterium]MCF8431601.1 hypothetical protein [Melioribacteraceae bacterium]